MHSSTGGRSRRLYLRSVHSGWFKTSREVVVHGSERNLTDLNPFGDVEVLGVFGLAGLVLATVVVLVHRRTSFRRCSESERIVELGVRGIPRSRTRVVVELDGSITRFFGD